MSVASSHAISINALPGWSILFAKEPATAGDPNQSDMDKTVVLGPPGKKGPAPPSMKERILFLVLILLIVCAGGYLAVNPDLLVNLLGDAPGETPPPQIPAKVAKPVTLSPAPAPTPIPGQPAAPASAAQPAAMTPAAAPAAPMPTPATTPGVPSIPTPQFGEGQKVSVSAPTPLTSDSAGKKPGTATATPGSTLVIVDADLQSYAWVYSVRTEQGVTGWVAEKNLIAK